MLRICHIISGDLWAGAEVMCHNLITTLHENDNLAIDVIVLNKGKLYNQLYNSGINVHLIDESKLPFFKILYYIKNNLTKYPPDIIHSHRYKENITAFILKIICATKCKIVATQHGMPEVFVKKVKVRKYILSKLNLIILKKFNKLTVVSNDIKKQLVNKCNFNKNKIHVIHNGINLPKLKQGRKDSNIFIIGSAGRLFPVKDYPLMVEIAKEIKNKTDCIKFELAGDGPEHQTLRNLIKKNGLENTFVLKGHVHDIAKFYQNLDIYLSTSVHEGISMSVLEAMSYGIPVVAPDVGGFSEIIKNGNEGYLINTRNPKNFANKCCLLYNNKQLNKNISKAARNKIIESFSNKKMADNYYKMYLTLTQNHNLNKQKTTRLT